MIWTLIGLLFPAVSSTPTAEPVPLVADENPSLDPREGKKGKVYKWKAADGLPYEYYVPKDYDPEKGANLTFVLHGNGLDHRWTFWNHTPGEFRKDDIVISPDGTSILQSTGNPEFLSGQKDVDRLHALIEEMKSVFQVNQTFLYGHSQGSFFVFLYAGEYPDDIDGVCGHAGAGWSVQQNKKGHHIAIGFLHGTADHIGHWQASGARETYVEAKYPLTHLRTLFDWGHPPHMYQAENVLSWCEGMTSENPDRVEECLDYLAVKDRPMGVDFSATWAVANRLASMKDANASQKKKGQKVAKAVDELCAKHLKAIEKGLGKKGKLTTLAKGDWAGILIRLVEEFHGVPSLEAFEKKNKKAIAKIRDEASDALKAYYQNSEKDPKKAFAAGLDLLEKGYLEYRCVEVRKKMEAWVMDAKNVGLGKRDLQRWEEIGELYTECRADGFGEFEKANRKVKF